MRALPAAVAALLLAGCSSGPPAAQPPAPPPEILVVAVAGGAHEILGTRDGRVLATLPAGLLVAGLSGGGDIAEAYLVAAAPSGSTSIQALLPSRDYGLSEVASQEGSVRAAALLPAPGLTSFVGRRTVLALLGADGRLTGYQHGNRIWSMPLPGPEPELRSVGDVLMAGSRGSWRPVDLRDGAPGLPLTEQPCSPGPVAETQGRTVLDCGGTLQPGGAAAPADLPAVLPAGGASLLYFPGGELWRVQGSSARRVARGPAWTSPPLISPDGSTVYVATDRGVEAIAAAGGSARLLLALDSPGSIALSRDGNFLYSLAAGRLLTFRVGAGRVGSVAAPEGTIELVAGG